MPRRIAPVLALLIPLPLAGCIALAAGAAAGYGAYEYQDGLYTVSVPGTLDAAIRATRAALDQSGAAITAHEREATQALFRIRTADQRNAEITLARGYSGDFTRVSIRFGLFGDKPRSQQLVARIKENL